MNKNIEIYVTGESDKKFFNDFNDNFHIKYLTNCEHKLENIDFLNPYFCELTGLFYLWKHSDKNIVGLEQYRRYFLNDDRIFLTENDIIKLLKNYDILCAPCPNFDFNNVRFSGMFGNKLAFEFASKFWKFKNIYNNILEYGNEKKQLLYSNMFICNKNIIDEYCNFLFNDILNDGKMKQEIAKGIKRSIAWTAEFTFGFWLEKIKKYNVKYQNNIEFNKISDIKYIKENENGSVK